MHGRQHAASLPVQVESVTEEELRSEMEMDWNKELRQLAILLRPKLLFLLKKKLIDDCICTKLLRMRGIVSNLCRLASIM